MPITRECGKCRKEAFGQFPYCPDCGGRIIVIRRPDAIVRTCPKCGIMDRSNYYKHCLSCGAKLPRQGRPEYYGY